MKESVFLSHINPLRDKMFRLSKRLLVSTDEAQDAVQEILLRLWKNASQLEKYRNVEAFTMSMTKNYCLDRLKSKQAENVSISQSGYEKENSHSLQKEIETRDTFSRVQQIIDKLPEQQRLVLQLRDIEQYEFDEIEEIMGVKSVTVRVILSRARKALKEMVIKQLGNE